MKNLKKILSLCEPIKPLYRYNYVTKIFLPPDESTQKVTPDAIEHGPFRVGCQAR